MDAVITRCMSLIRYEIFNKPLDIDFSEGFTEDVLKSLYTFSKNHDVAHIVGTALEKNGLMPKEGELAQKFQKQSFLAIYRYQQLQHTYDKVCSILEEEQIDYVPLKGAIIRPYYPEAWMRTSCDIDILVHQEDSERAARRIEEVMGTVKETYRNFHDISLILPGNVHLELHFTLEESVPSFDAVLSQVWEHVYKPNPESVCHLETNEFLLFHMIAHNAYHFVAGGCGIRPFIDWHLLRGKIEFDRKKLDSLLNEANLKSFADAMDALSDVWMGERKHTPLTLDMENYIFFAGAYGSLENQIAVASENSDGRTKYLLYRIFMPYRTLKKIYPVLEKYPILYPVCTVRRWFRILFGNRKGAMRELKQTVSYSDEKKKSVSNLCRELKLNNIMIK